MKLIVQNTRFDYDIGTADLKPNYSHPDFNLRGTDIQRYGKPGVRRTGDKQTGSRDIRLTLDLRAKTDSEFIEKIEGLIEAFNPDYGPTYLIDVENQRRAEIELSRMRVDSVKGNVMRMEKLDLTLPMIDGYWESLDEIVILSDSTGTESGQIIQVENPGILRSYPLIRVTPTGNNPEFSLFNNTTQDIFRFGSNSLVVGSELEADSRDAGKIWISDGISRIESSFGLADGAGLLFLEPGVNDIEYQSVYGPAFIEIRFRRGYPF